MNENGISIILSYGDRYCKEMLYQMYVPEQLKDSAWEALKFFFERAFYQGRRDNISAKVNAAAVGVLEPAKTQLLYGNFEQVNLELLKNKLQTKIGKGKVGKARDIEMVISTLRYISRLPEKNIVNHSLQRINAGRIGEHFNELQRSRNQAGIYQVGPKIAAFYLRDVVAIFQLEDKVPTDFQFALQPIDTWVRRIAFRMDIVPPGASDEQIRQAIISLCEDRACSPIRFNQGAWYAGAHAYDLLIERLRE